MQMSKAVDPKMDAVEAVPLLGTKNESADNDLESNDAPETSRPGEEEDDLLDPLRPKVARERLARCGRRLFVFSRPLLPLLALDGVSAFTIAVARNWICAPGLSECVAALAFVHAAFFHASARTVERETVRFDDKTSGPPLDEKCAKAPLPGSDNGEEEDCRLLYGRAARSVDDFLAKYCDNGPCDAFASGGNGSSKRSMLAHLCWILFALCFAFGTMAASNSIVRGDICKIPLPQPKPSLNSSNYAPVENTSGYPKELQQWIAADNRVRIPPRGYGFPVTCEETYQYTNPKTGRGVLSTEKDELGLGHPVLVEHVSANQTFVTHMHREVIFPSLFVPVQSTLIVDGAERNHRRERAGQYCLATKNEIAHKKTSRVYCLDTRGVQSDRPAILKNTTLEWSFEGTKSSPRGNSGKAIAASFQDMVFFGKVCPNGDFRCREVYRVDPNTMETELVYSAVSILGVDGYDDSERRRYRDKRRSYTNIRNVAGICGLACAVFHLIVHRGVESGAVFVGWALVLPLGYLNVAVGTVCSLVTVFYQCLIHCDTRQIHPCLSFRKNASIWALYGVLVPFAYLALTELPERIDRDREPDFTVSLVHLALNGAILGHPMFQAIGCSFVATGGFSLLGCILWSDDFKHPNAYGGWLMCGFGCIMVGNWCTANRRWYYPRGTYHLRTFFAWLERETC